MQPALTLQQLAVEVRKFPRNECVGSPRESANAKTSSVELRLSPTMETVYSPVEPRQPLFPHTPPRKPWLCRRGRSCGLKTIKPMRYPDDPFRAGTSSQTSETWLALLSLWSPAFWLPQWPTVNHLMEPVEVKMLSVMCSRRIPRSWAHMDTLLLSFPHVGPISILSCFR
jgi:hypothetical protein